MKKKSLIVVFIFFSTLLFSQNLTIADGRSVNINSDVSININGLELTPSSTFSIVGTNQIDRSSAAITSGSDSSINRVFIANNPVNNFVGTIVYKYEDSELNGLDESILELQVKNDTGTWNNYSGTLNITDNTITNTFGSAISFTDITAAQNDASFSIESIGYTNIRLYPNPTTSQLFIDYDAACEITLYNMQGQLLLKTNEKVINMSIFNNALYVLIIKDALYNTTKIYKIIKQ
jgi:hypothetical protein